MTSRCYLCSTLPALDLPNYNRYNFYLHEGGSLGAKPTSHQAQTKAEDDDTGRRAAL